MNIALVNKYFTQAT